MRHKTTLVLVVAASCTSWTYALAGGVEVCNEIVRANLFDETAVFKLDDGKTMSKHDYCEKYNKGEGGSINVVGYGDGKMNNSEAHSVCSSDFSSSSSETILQTYSKYFSDNLKHAYETCLQSVSQNPNIQIDPQSTQISWSPGLAKGKDGRQFPHYKLALGFRWIPYDVTASTKTRAWVTRSEPGLFVDTDVSWGEKSTQPGVLKPGDPVDNPHTTATIKPNSLCTVSTQVVESVDEEFVVVQLEKGGSFKLIFPKKP